MAFVEREVAEVWAFLQRFLAGERGFTSSDAVAGVVRLGELQQQLRDPERRRESRDIARRVCEKLRMNGPLFDWMNA